MNIGNRVSHFLVNVPGFGTWHFWYLWSGKEDYNRVIKGEGIRFWPVSSHSFILVHYN
jgi:hypothetical protein